MMTSLRVCRFDTDSSILEWSLRCCRGGSCSVGANKRRFTYKEKTSLLLQTIATTHADTHCWFPTCKKRINRNPSRINRNPSKTEEDVSANRSREKISTSTFNGCLLPTIIMQTYPSGAAVQQLEEEWISTHGHIHLCVCTPPRTRSLGCTYTRERRSHPSTHRESASCTVPPISAT